MSDEVSASDALSSLVCDARYGNNSNNHAFTDPKNHKKCEQDIIDCEKIVRQALQRPDVCNTCKGTGGVEEYYDGTLESSEPCPTCNPHGVERPDVDVEALKEQCLQYGKEHMMKLNNPKIAICRMSVYLTVNHLAERGYLKTEDGSNG